MMASEQEQVKNRALMWGYVVVAMSRGIWDLVEDSSSAMSPQIGMQLLALIEKKINRVHEGETPEEILEEVAKAFVDEMGYASDYSVEKKDDVIIVTLKHAVGSQELAALQQSGLTNMFSHPFLCCGIAAVNRIGKKTKASVVIEPSTNTQTVTFKIL